jgi:hypothetical protein
VSFFDQYIYVYLHECVCGYIYYVCTHVCMYVCICKYVCIHTAFNSRRCCGRWRGTHTHAHTHTHTHTHTNTHKHPGHSDALSGCAYVPDTLRMLIRALYATQVLWSMARLGFVPDAALIGKMSQHLASFAQRLDPPELADIWSTRNTALIAP